MIKYEGWNSERGQSLITEHPRCEDVELLNLYVWSRLTGQQKQYAELVRTGRHAAAVVEAAA